VCDLAQAGVIESDGMFTLWVCPGVQDVSVGRGVAVRHMVFKHFRLGEINIYFSYNGKTTKRDVWR
jgi:hypothetical protein